MKSRSPKKTRALPKRRASLRSPRLKKGNPNARPIWEAIVELGASVPESEWKKVPTDLSINLEHYLYGAPKEEHQ